MFDSPNSRCYLATMLISIRKNSTLHGHNLVLICFGALQTFCFALLPYLNEITQISLPTLILGLSLGTLCFLPGTIFWNAKSDEGKTISALRINAFCLCLSLFTIVVMLFASLPSLGYVVLFLVGRLIWGLGASGINGLGQHIRLSRSSSKVKAVTSNSLVLNLGRTLGPSMLLLPFEIKFITLGFFIFTTCTFLVNLFQNEDSVTEIKKRKAPLFNHSKVILPAVILCFLMTLGTGLIHSGLGSYLVTEFSVSGTDASIFTGSLLLTGSLVMMAGHFMAGNIKDKNWKVLIIIGLINFVAGLFSFQLVNVQENLFLSVGLVCFGVSFLYPGTIMLMNQLIEKENQGKALGIMSMVSTLGAAAGGIVLSFSQVHFVSLLSFLGLALIVSGFKITSGKNEVLWKA